MQESFWGKLSLPPRLGLVHYDLQHTRTAYGCGVGGAEFGHDGRMEYREESNNKTYAEVNL